MVASMTKLQRRSRPGARYLRFGYQEGQKTPVAATEARPRHKTGSGLFQVTKSVIFLVAICLLLSTPGLAYGAQLLHPSPGASTSAMHHPFLMPQDRCVPPPAVVGDHATQ